MRTEVCSSIFASSVAVLNALGPAPLLLSSPRIIETAMGATVPETPAIGSPLFIFQTSALNSSWLGLGLGLGLGLRLGLARAAR